MAGLQELVLELTDWCPLDCRHCSSESGPRCRNHLPPDLVLRLIDEAAELGASQISFGGGEPTRSPLLPSALEHAAAVGLLSEVFTCGVSAEGGSPGPLPARLTARSSSVRGAKFIFSIVNQNEDGEEQGPALRVDMDADTAADFIQAMRDMLSKEDTDEI